MGISERKEREKEDLRLRILEAAKELFIQKGYEQTSIRNIAEKIEYSPTTIYLYYKDKDAIFLALHSEGFKLLNTKMAVLQHVSAPFERLKAMGKIYIDFALENKELYDLMFIQNAPMDCLNEDDENWKEGELAFNFLQGTVLECMQKGELPQGDPEDVAFFIWSSMHGMCSLFIRQRCSHVIKEEKRETILQKGYEVMIGILESLKNN